MFHRYDYEAEFYPALSRLPLDLRRKLDVTGIKISLKHWLAYSMEERAVLCHLPCDSDDEKEVFQRYLDFLSGKYLGQPAERTAVVSESSGATRRCPKPSSSAVSRCASPSRSKNGAAGNRITALVYTRLRSRKISPRRSNKSCANCANS